MLTKIINIDARSNPNVAQFFQAGDYKVEYIGKVQGDLFNAWY